MHEKLVVKSRPTRNWYTRFLWCASTATPALARKRREIFSSTISLGSCSAADDLPLPAWSAGHQALVRVPSLPPLPRTMLAFGDRVPLTAAWQT